MGRRVWGSIPLAALAAAMPAAADPGEDGVQFHIDGQFLLGFGGTVAGDFTRPDPSRREDAAAGDLLVRLRAEERLGDVTAGLVVRLRGQEPETAQPPDAEGPVKDAYLSIRSDAIGEFRLGESSDVRRNKGYTAPQICDCQDGLFGTAAPEVTFDRSPVPNNSTVANEDRRAAKLAWYSPTASGFQLGLSYAPEAARGADPPDPAEPAARDFGSAALSWDHLFGDVAVGLESGMTEAKQGGADPDRLLIWDAGGQLRYGPWVVAGGWEVQHGVEVSGIYGLAQLLPAAAGPLPYRPVARGQIVTRSVDLGFTYAIGPVTAGLAWSRGLYEGLSDAADVKHAAINDIVFAGGDYRIDPRLSLLAGLDYDRYDPGSVPVTATLWTKPYGALGLVFGAVLKF